MCPKCKSPYWNRLRRRANGRVNGAAQLKDARPARATTLSSDFWSLRGFDNLAAEQAVGPVGGWDDVAGGWPEGTDFDVFLEAVRESRKQ